MAARRALLDSRGMSPRLFCLVFALAASASWASPRLLDDDAPAPGRGWLLAQAGVPPTGMPTQELQAIDARIAQLLSNRPSKGRVAVGVVMTVLGGLSTVAGAIIFVVGVSVGQWALLVSIFVGLPLVGLGLGLLIPGIVMWTSGVAGQREADREIEALRAQRQQLLESQPQPLPLPPPVPQVWRSAPAPAMTVAVF